jgi:hypothetical protein
VSKKSEDSSKRDGVARSFSCLVTIKRDLNYLEILVACEQCRLHGLNIIVGSFVCEGETFIF